jgi:hypothetical protein
VHAQLRAVKLELRPMQARVHILQRQQGNAQDAAQQEIDYYGFDDQPAKSAKRQGADVPGAQLVRAIKAEVRQLQAKIVPLEKRQRQLEVGPGLVWAACVGLLLARWFHTDLPP